MVSTDIQNSSSASTVKMENDNNQQIKPAQALTPDPKGVMGSDYAKSKRQLMDLINSIGSTGASLDVDLPSIVVAGNQSSGKSRLIEAISGINMPRDAGTCTKVPMEVRLRQDLNKEWSCTVYLRREIDESGTLPYRQQEERSARADINTDAMQQPLDNISEVPFGPTLTDPSQVEMALRRAQLAILNPSVESSRFVSYEIPTAKSDESGRKVELPLGSTKQLGFSKNVVGMNITGPDVTDLTLVDLPGIISSVGQGEDPANIPLVTNLTRHYIEKDCLILLTITMKDDIQNQKAVMLAHEADPEGKRTIGVLTKVDTLTGEVETNQWLPIVKGEKERLLHGYYVTRQLNPDELAHKISFEQARAKEAAFFADTKPWNSLGSQHKARFGTKNLTAYLSDQLMAFIKSKLPSLIDKINETHENVVTGLSALPAPPSADPSTEMLFLTQSFIQDLRASVEGTAHHEKLIQDVMSAYRSFKTKIWATAPRFVPYNKAEITADSSKSFHGADFVGELEETTERDMGTGGLKRPAKDLNDVHDHIAKSMTRELPHNVPFASKISLIEDAIVDWEALALETFDITRPHVEAVLSQLVNYHYAKYTEGMLPTTVNAVIRDQITRLSQNTRESTVWLVRLDATPFTLNDHYYNDLRSKMLAHLKDKRYPKPYPQSSNTATVKSNKDSALAYLATLGYTGLTEADLKKLRPVDKYETELEVMAETRAYFQVAYKRIIDNLPRLIDAEFIKPLPAALQRALIEELAISDEGGREKCRAFLAESPNITRQRDELMQRRNRLQQAKDAIRRFGA